jgi:tRNA (mo5U34)-methyltransferase
MQDKFDSFGDPYQRLHSQGRAELAEQAWQRLRSNGHGDLLRWLEAIEAMPFAKPDTDLDRSAPVIGAGLEEDEEKQKKLVACLQELHPWRKGPLQLGGVHIETEWRSDWKWERIAQYLDLEGKEVLDIGCGNGYFGLRMLAEGARLVVGIDPTMGFVMQWLAMQKLAPQLNQFVLPLGIEELPADLAGFDCVLSMGVLYHRRDHLEHLRRLKELALPGGQILLETLIVEAEGEYTLLPNGRYARMRNVHAIPSLETLLSWLRQAGMLDYQVLDVSRTSTDEQRSTDWMRFESLRESLNENDMSLTVEGHPAPVRAAVLITI